MILWSISQWIREKRASGDSSKLILSVVVVVVMLVCLGAVGIALTGSGSNSAKPARAFWCVEKEEMYRLDDIDRSEERQLGEFGPRARLTNPDTGKKTLVLMQKCPAEECGEFYLPESFRKPPNPDSGPMSRGICPNCGADVDALFITRARSRAN